MVLETLCVRPQRQFLASGDVALSHREILRREPPRQANFLIMKLHRISAKYNPHPFVRRVSKHVTQRLGVVKFRVTPHQNAVEVADLLERRGAQVRQHTLHLSAACVDEFQAHVLSVVTKRLGADDKDGEGWEVARDLHVALLDAVPQHREGVEDLERVPLFCSHARALDLRGRGSGALAVHVVDHGLDLGRVQVQEILPEGVSVVDIGERFMPKSVDQNLAGDGEGLVALDVGEEGGEDGDAPLHLLLRPMLGAEEEDVADLRESDRGDQREARFDEVSVDVALLVLVYQIQAPDRAHYLRRGGARLPFGA
mmetsp:Transcript_39275/g.92770  ORF Transcript_39275/g.92770 Transcript_39275/m.92770 type:complete len:312 (-) Transcript_39275:1000-1935(-)